MVAVVACFMVRPSFSPTPRQRAPAGRRTVTQHRVQLAGWLFPFVSAQGIIVIALFVTGVTAMSSFSPDERRAFLGVYGPRSVGTSA